MLHRLCVGLIGEGVQVTRIVPDSIEFDSVDEGEQRVALAARIEAPMRVLPWMRHARANAIAEALGRKLPDVLYAVGERAWSLGADLATTLNRPCLIDVCSIVQAKAVPRPRGTSFPAGYLAPSQTIAKVLADRVDPGMVSMVPMGVPLPPEPRTILADTDRAAALAIIGSGRDLRAYEALLDGLARVVQQTRPVQVFIELRGPYDHEIWRHAQKLELLAFISAIEQASLYRSLLTRCDLLLMPERWGELRSLLLEAMALGVPVIASQDHTLDLLVDGQSAFLVPKTDPADWTQRILQVLSHPESARAIGLNARQAVATSHRSSDHVAKLIETLEKTISGGALRFTQPSK